MEQIKHTEELTLAIDLKDFNKCAVTLVDGINDKIKTELMHTACGLIEGTLPAGRTWLGMFYRSMEEQKFIQLTDFGRECFKI